MEITDLPFFRKAPAPVRETFVATTEGPFNKEGLRTAIQLKKE